MSFYLGIDGGGTKTRCALGDEHKVLAISVAGGSNITRTGATQAREVLQKGVREVCAAANISPDKIAAICMGASGGGRPEAAISIRQSLAELTPAPVEIVGDMVIALEAAFGSGTGAIVIAGTGSVAYGRDAQGNTTRAGGWGFAVSDEGSGHWIGRRAVTAVLRAQDEGQQSTLPAGIYEAWNLKTVDDLVIAANAIPARDFSRLFPVVLNAAGNGDALARGLLGEAGNELSRLASLVIRHLPHPPYAPVAMTGSVFRRSEEVRRVFHEELESHFPGIEIRQEIVDPVEGALSLARKARRA